ncbi:MAG: hypothetical protein QXP53_00290 [Candidatus Pacearchaeota archaeon]
MRTKNLVSLVLGAIAGSYLLVKSIDTNIKLNKAIAPLREEFKKTALTAPYQVKTITSGLDERTILDYGGKLDEILKKRDEILKNRYAIPVGWNVFGEYNNKILKICPGPCLVLSLNPFCNTKINYNPN